MKSSGDSEILHEIVHDTTVQENRKIMNLCVQYHEILPEISRNPTSLHFLFNSVYKLHKIVHYTLETNY